MNHSSGIGAKSGSTAGIHLTSPQVQTMFQEGLALQHRGQLEQARNTYRQVLKLQPNHFEALHLLGVIAAQSKDYAQAVDFISKSIAINPNNATAHANLGNVCKDLAQYQAAIESYDRAITIKPDYANAYFNRGLAYYFLKQYQAAIMSYSKVTALKPDHVDAYSSCGLALHFLQHYHAAIASYDKAILLKPDHAEVHFNRGAALYALRQHQASIASYDKAIALNPEHATAYCNRGNAFKELKQHQAAIDCYDRAITIKPDYAEAYCNRGVASHGLKQYQAAIDYYDKAITINPNYADAYSNRGIALAELRQYQAAIDSYDRAIAIKPDYAEAHLNQSLCLLQKGDFEQGWAKFEWRWQTTSIDSFRNKRHYAQPLWLGAEPLQGKTILLYSEQGLGDTIQFCRYATLVSQLGARVILEVQCPLRDLLTKLEGVAEVFITGDRLPTFDYHCPLLSLPLAFNTAFETIPASASYLASDPGKVEHWKARLGNKTRPRVGLVWSGNAEQKNDVNRSISLAELASKLPHGFEYVSLQKELRDADSPTLKEFPEILHFGEELQDFTDTAALCELVDIVFSVCTSVAHLAGALGKPVWIALTFNADWRWLLDRSDTPWYPSARLYRQEAAGDWDAVFQRISHDLKVSLLDS